MNEVATPMSAAVLTPPQDITSMKPRNTDEVNNLSHIFPPFTTTLPPVGVVPAQHQYKHSSHQQHELQREMSLFKCSVCRTPNLTQGRHKCSSCDWNACQKCMDLDFLTNRPVNVTNTATPTPKTPTFAVGNISVPVLPSLLATAAKKAIVVDTTKAVPSSPSTKRAPSVSPQQLGGYKVAKVALQSPAAVPSQQDAPLMQSLFGL